MELAKDAHIHEFCQPNAILTFKENLVNVASDETKKMGEELLKREIEKIEGDKVKAETVKRLERIEAGEKDLYF